MSKDFEQAYKEAAQMEAPDLWDRIEAGLKEKSVPERKGIWEEAGTREKRDKRKYFGNFFGRYSGVIAAAVCVMVMIPAAVLIRQTSKGYSASGAAGGIEESIDAEAGENAAMPAQQAETALADREKADMAMPQTAMSAGTGADADMGMDGGADADMGMDSGAGADTGMATGDETGTGAGMRMSGGTGADAGMKASSGTGLKGEDDAAMVPDCAEAIMESAEDSVNPQTDAAANLHTEAANKNSAAAENGGYAEDSAEESTVMEHVVIKVTELGEDFDREGDSGILCTAVLQNNASGSQPLTIYIPESERESFYEGGVFEVDLACQSGGEYSFALRKYHREIK